VNLIGSIQATETIKFLVGTKNKVRRTLLSFDVWSNEQAEITASRPRPGCQTCDRREFIHLTGERRPQITLCGRNSVQIHERNRPVDFAEMSARLGVHGTVKHNAFVLKFWRESFEMTLFPDGRAIIKGTDNPSIARSLYARFVGS
jgi:molybdopterin-synthase adenylyltransferase